MSRMSISSGAEIPQILQCLDQGTVMIKFFKRRGNRPEKRIFCLKTDTFEILQFPMARGKLTQCEETSRLCMYEMSHYAMHLVIKHKASLHSHLSLGLLTALGLWYGGG